jgi:photosystem II stability/assembly factor-like uncharacterized protein
MSVTCAGRECLVAGDNQDSSTNPVASIIATTDLGQSWTTLATPPFASQAVAVSCSPEGTCLFLYGAGEVIVDAVAFSTDGGRNWAVRSTSVEPWGQMTSASCPSSTTCYTTGNSTLKTTDQGRTWSEVPVPPAPQTGLSYLTVDETTCATADNCWLVGSEGYKVVAWTAQHGPP